MNEDERRRYWMAIPYDIRKPWDDTVVAMGQRGYSEEEKTRYIENRIKEYHGQSEIRNKFIATIQRNRMNAGKLGHKGVRPVSHSDLIELNKMSTADLEQTAKLTWQLTRPVVGQGNPGKEYPLYDYYGQCPTARYVGGTSKYLCECPQPMSCPGVIAVQRARQAQGNPGNSQQYNLSDVDKTRMASEIAKSGKMSFQDIIILPVPLLIEKYRRLHRR